jgi:hypothetical protein
MMKNKIKIVQIDDKADEAIALSKRMSPRERIYLMFELIEISNQLRPQNSSQFFNVEEPLFIILKKRNHAIS